ncbi:MAG TPA: hypothetical protein VF375_02475 [Candidatus Limnocylindrales bacterium]
MGTTAQFRPTFGLIKTVGAALALAGLVAGCSVAGASPSASQASPSASQASPSAAGSPSPSAVASASASTSPSAAPATIGPAPSGTWTSLKWVDEHNAFPQTPTPSTGDGGTQNSLFGWSKGYIGFRTAYDITTGNSPAKTATVSTSSGEGVHWTAGRPMDIEGLKGAIFVSEVIEGPSGLLALGFYGATACGGPTTVDAFWTSLDGSSWTRVALSGDFASASIYTVDGGSVGFIATGTLKDGTTQAIWTSTDGRNWRRAAVPTVATGTFVLNGATGFASGYVVGGAIQGDEGCGGFNLLTPSLWWSATGSSWTRVKLPGATPASDATMTVTRISDHVLMAIAWESNGAGVTTQTVWYTSNGHDWKLVASPSALLGGTVVSDGRRGLVVSTPPESGMPVVATVGDDLSVTPLVETGAVPGANGSGIFAVGPAGVVCLSNDGTSLSLGVPAE